MKYLYAVLLVLICGLILGLALAIANKFLKVEENPHKDKINALLPGVNCGACGFPGCSGLAQAFVDGKCTKAAECKVVKGETAQKLQAYLDEMNANRK